MKGKWQWLLRAGVWGGLTVIIVWAASRLNWSHIGRELQGASLPLAAAMGACWIAALLIRPMRMVVLIGAMAPEIRRRYWPVWSADVVAMGVNSVVPMRAGDMMIAFMLRQGLEMRIARGMSVVLVDRFFDFATVIVLFVTMLAAAPTVVPWAHDVTLSLVLALGILVTGLVAAIHVHRFWGSLLERLFSHLPARFARTWHVRARDLLDGLALIDHPRVIVLTLLLSILQWSAITASWFFGVQALWPHMTWAAAAFGASAVALSFVVPVAPGGFGVFHGATVLALSLFKVPAEPALAFAIVAHAFQMGSVLILGAIALLWQGISLGSLAGARQMSP